MREPDDIYDEWLVLRSQEGDAAALAELVERWQPRLWRHAMRLSGMPEAANDIVQQSWLAIIHGLRRLDDAARFRRWAYRIVSNKCADWIRERQRQRATTSALDCELSEPEDSVGATIVDDAAALRSALGRLSSGHRAALSMFYVEEMSLAEIAEALSLPLGTVKSRLHYARQELKTILKGRLK
jgi:RNA polymerase sigma-70 factor (ECF subfamily)